VVKLQVHLRGASKKDWERHRNQPVRNTKMVGRRAFALKTLQTIVKTCLGIRKRKKKKKVFVGPLQSKKNLRSRRSMEKKRVVNSILELDDGRNRHGERVWLRKENR